MRHRIWSATYTATVMVTPVNDAPVIKPITPLSSVDSGKVVLDVSKFTSDVDGDVLTYKATGLPPGLKIDPATGVISGTLTKDASQGGPYTVTLTVDDGHGGVTTRTFAWPVTNPPPVAHDDTGTVKTGQSVTVPVLANDSDPDGDPLTVTRAKASNGTVTVGLDGAIKYAPRPGFVGTDTITYAISDGNGGTAIASVTIEVAGDNQTPKTSVFGFNGPELHDHGQQAAFDAPVNRITAEGAVVDAVYSVDQLNSIARQLTADGAVLAATNGVKSLDGLAVLKMQTPIVDMLKSERANDMLRLAGQERGFQVYDFDGLPGFSLRANVPGNLVGGGSREQVVIESIVRNRTLILQISNTISHGSREIVDYRITQTNGAPLPGWLDRAGRDLLIGERSAADDVLKLRLEAIYSDGSTVTQEVRIDTATGEIQPLKAGKQGSAAPALFRDQLKARPMLSPDQVEELARALAG